MSINIDRQKQLTKTIRNLIANGAIDFAQRGITKTLPSTETYLADRFSVRKTVTTSAWTGTYDVASDAPTAQQAGFNLSRCVRVTNGTGAAAASGDQYTIRHKLEGYDYEVIHGQSVRLQFWVKCSVSGTYSIAFENSAQNRTFVSTFSIAIGEINTWVFRYIDITMDTSGTWLFGNNLGLTIYWVLDAYQTDLGTATLNSWKSDNKIAANTQTAWANTTGAIFSLTGIALFPAQFPIIFPFSRTGSITDELLKCFRYCYAPISFPETGSLDTNKSGAFVVWHGSAVTTVVPPYSMRWKVPFKVPMRIKPTATTSNASSVWKNNQSPVTSLAATSDGTLRNGGNLVASIGGIFFYFALGSGASWGSSVVLIYDAEL